MIIEGIEKERKQEDKKKKKMNIFVYGPWNRSMLAKLISLPLLKLHKFLYIDYSIGLTSA